MVLAVESATELAGVALADGDGVLAVVSVGRGRRHAESVTPAVVAACARAGVTLRDVDAVVVDVGPGLFTGLRVGVGTAKALAFALERPLVGVSSLEVLAQAVAGAGAADGTVVVPVVDARRGEVFTGRFEAAGGGAHRRGDDVRRAPDALAAELAGMSGAAGPLRRVVLTGDGARRHLALLGAVPGVACAGPAYDHPSPAVLAALGHGRAATGAGEDAAAVLPRYLREADVRINWERRTRRAGALGGTGPGA